MNKYYLIWSYHDINLDVFYTLSELNNYLNCLKNGYKNDSDFSYKIIFGQEIKTSE